ncbi:MAG: hypothetical protein M3327_00465, partial [Actinomycetota bacterium]|nr:hypothetical protein [Actinomycetota bacterium]
RTATGARLKQASGPLAARAEQLGTGEAAVTVLSEVLRGGVPGLSPALLRGERAESLGPPVTRALPAPASPEMKRNDRD